MFRKSYLIFVFSLLILTAGNTHYAISQPPSFMNPSFFRSYIGYYGEQRAGRSNPHWGLDITGSVPGQIEAANVFASESGRVSKVGYESTGAGKYIEIDHGNGYVTRYLHLQENINVKEEQEVTRGMTIGYVGRTGNAEGPHLHFEILYLGIPLNPLDFLPNAFLYVCRSVASG